MVSVADPYTHVLGFPDRYIYIYIYIYNSNVRILRIEDNGEMNPFIKWRTSWPYIFLKK
jgi:hypothetical protein